MYKNGVSLKKTDYPTIKHPGEKFFLKLDISFKNFLTYLPGYHGSKQSGITVGDEVLLAT